METSNEQQREDKLQAEVEALTKLRQEKEHRQWEEVEKKAWFHEREEEITSESWHDREATRAIKDEEID